MSAVSLKDGKSFVELIAGEYNGTKGPASTFSPVNLFNARLYKGGKADFSFDEKYNTGILIIEGEIKINNYKTAAENYFIYFGHEGDSIELEAVKDSIVLILSGEPLNEPIASNGPFLMNTEAEIKQAYEDYYNGKFGYLED
jgi:redox-sensitive bicupin YhaK (pirin superfamily)